MYDINETVYIPRPVTIIMKTVLLSDYSLQYGESCFLCTRKCILFALLTKAAAPPSYTHSLYYDNVPPQTGVLLF